MQGLSIPTLEGVASNFHVQWHQLFSHLQEVHIDKDYFSRCKNRGNTELHCDTYLAYIELYSSSTEAVDKQTFIVDDRLTVTSVHVKRISSHTFMRL